MKITSGSVCNHQRHWLALHQDKIKYALQMNSLVGCLSHTIANIYAPPPHPLTHTHLPPPPPARYPFKLNQQGPVKVTNSWRLYLFKCRVFLSNFPHANFTNAANLDIIVFEKTEMLSPMLPWTGKLITPRKEAMIKWVFFSSYLTIWCNKGTG